MRKKRLGFTLVEIMIVVAIIGLLAAIAVPAFMKARQSAQRSACINNLRMINDGKAQWALDDGGQTGDTPALTNISDYIADTNKLFCPMAPKALRSNFANSYSINGIGANPECKIDLGGTNNHDLSYSGA
jgi:type IV pilus assembly protein PilA